jgi:hypothetical protein
VPAASRVACFPLHFHFCLSPYETQYPIKATRLDPLEQNKMGNSCAVILITLTVLVMVPGLTADAPTLKPLLLQQTPGTWTRLPRSGAVHPERIPRHAGGVIDPATSVLYFFGSAPTGMSGTTRSAAGHGRLADALRPEEPSARQGSAQCPEELVGV